MRPLKRILVTGGSGFIGSACIRYFLNLSNHSVKICNIDKLTYAARANAHDHPSYQFHQLDICNENQLFNVINEFKPDTILHFAAETHVDRSIQDSDPFINSNICGTHSLLKCCLNYWKSLNANEKDHFIFLHVSTDEVYGSITAGSFSENAICSPSSPYSASKSASDQLVLAWNRTHQLPIIITRSSNNYGPFQYPEKLIPFFVTQALKHNPMTLYGKGNQIRNWIYVDDHIDAIYTILSKGSTGEIYNIGTQEEKTNLEVANLICDILSEVKPNPNLDYKSLIQFIDDRPGHDFRYSLDTSKLNQKLNWHPKTKFKDGLKETIQWYLDHQDWIKKTSSQSL